MDEDLSKWYKAFWDETQKQNRACLVQSKQYHAT